MSRRLPGMPLFRGCFSHPPMRLRIAGPQFSRLAEVAERVGILAAW